MTQPPFIYKPPISAKQPLFYKIVLESYPEFEVTDNVNWRKHIHNYKAAIYKNTYESFDTLWNLKSYGFEIIHITVIDNKKMNVSFSDEFISSLERLYPDNKLQKLRE